MPLLAAASAASLACVTRRLAPEVSLSCSVMSKSKNGVVSVPSRLLPDDVDPHVVLGDARSVADVDQQAGAESARDRPGVVGDRGVDIDDIVVDRRVAAH